jgi:hypothetical protein
VNKRHILVSERLSHSSSDKNTTLAQKTQTSQRKKQPDLALKKFSVIHNNLLSSFPCEVYKNRATPKATRLVAFAFYRRFVYYYPSQGYFYEKDLPFLGRLRHIKNFD